MGYIPSFICRNMELFQPVLNPFPDNKQLVCITFDSYPKGMGSMKLGKTIYVGRGNLKTVHPPDSLGDNLHQRFFHLSALFPDKGYGKVKFFRVCKVNLGDSL